MSGRCPGYVVDHVMPLECGGADAPEQYAVTDSRGGQSQGQAGEELQSAAKKDAHCAVYADTTSTIVRSLD